MGVCSFGGGRNQKTNESMMSDLLWKTCCPQLNHLAMDHPKSSLYISCLAQWPFCVYMLQHSAHPSETKDAFYDKLDTVIQGIPTMEHLFMLADFNTQVKSNHDSCPSCISHFGISKLNENGQRLLDLCSYHNLCIMSTFFANKPSHRVYWRHPRSRYCHQLDLVLTLRPC